MSNEGSERQVAKIKAMNSRHKVKGENKLNNEEARDRKTMKSTKSVSSDKSKNNGHKVS